MVGTEQLHGEAQETVSRISQFDTKPACLDVSGNWSQQKPGGGGPLVSVSVVTVFRMLGHAWGTRVLLTLIESRNLSAQRMYDRV